MLALAVLRAQSLNYTLHPTCHRTHADNTGSAVTFPCGSCFAENIFCLNWEVETGRYRASSFVFHTWEYSWQYAGCWSSDLHLAVEVKASAWGETIINPNHRGIISHWDEIHCFRSPVFNSQCLSLKPQFCQFSPDCVISRNYFLRRPSWDPFIELPMTCKYKTALSSWIITPNTGHESHCYFLPRKFSWKSQRSSDVLWLPSSIYSTRLDDHGVIILSTLV